MITCVFILFSLRLPSMFFFFSFLFFFLLDIYGPSFINLLFLLLLLLLVPNSTEYVHFFLNYLYFSSSFLWSCAMVMRWSVMFSYVDVSENSRVSLEVIFRVAKSLILLILARSFFLRYFGDVKVMLRWLKKTYS